jgi:hypothetical protein
MQIEYKLTGDGILAFLGGAFALVAVWLSNRASTKNLERELDTEKYARQEERIQRNKALATALLFEIWDFHCHHVKPFLEKAEDSAAEHVKFFSRSFDVWKSNTGQIGQFDADIVKELVHFHDVASEYLATYDRYWSLDKYPDEQTRFFKEQLLSKLRKLEGLAEKVYLRLCPVAGVDPQNLKCKVSGNGQTELQRP